jgi:mitogen-activated protein kinase kinase
MSNMRPVAHNFSSAPAVPKAKPSLSERRKMKLPGGLPGSEGNGTPNSASGAQQNGNGQPGSAFTQFSNIVDTKKGTLNFVNKATIHGQGIDFTNGNSFSISLDEVDTLEELGKGNYGTVYKVRHARPKIRRPGLGLAGNKASSTSFTEKEVDGESQSPKGPSTSGVIMAMKELRLELDEAKFAAIIMELDILHRCLSPYIIDFYGAFFQEGAVYICIEFMDGGSIDKLYGDGIPENVLRKITYATTQGLKTLKDDHNIIHRDVKPTNILVNTRGQVKICDFGIAKTNIGCQSYMAPERISGGGMAQAGANPGGGTYSVQSDIWSLGLSIIECAMGRYPYPPETYNNIFSQLSVCPFLPFRFYFKN